MVKPGDARFGSICNRPLDLWSVQPSPEIDTGSGRSLVPACRCSATPTLMLQAFMRCRTANKKAAAVRGAVRDDDGKRQQRAHGGPEAGQAAAFHRPPSKKARVKPVGSYPRTKSKDVLPNISTPTRHTVISHTRYAALACWPDLARVLPTYWSDKNQCVPFHFAGGDGQ